MNMTPITPYRTTAIMIAEELKSILGEVRLAEWASTYDAIDDGWKEYEALVRTRLGGDYDPEAWDDALEILLLEQGVDVAG